MAIAIRQPTPIFFAIELFPPAGTGVWYCTGSLKKEVPQLAQNLAALSLANPQLGQNIDLGVLNDKRNRSLTLAAQPGFSSIVGVS